MHHRYREAQKDEKRFRIIRRRSNGHVTIRITQATAKRKAELIPIKAI
jgi:hypothetical protein